MLAAIDCRAHQRVRAAIPTAIANDPGRRAQAGRKHAVTFAREHDDLTVKLDCV